VFQLSQSKEAQKDANKPKLPWYKTTNVNNNVNSTGQQHNAELLNENPTASLLLGPQFFQYLNNLPEPLLKDFIDPSYSERAVRVKRQSSLQPGEQIYCEWNIKVLTEEITKY